MILISANTQLLVCLVVLQITPRVRYLNKLKLATECYLFSKAKRSGYVSPLDINIQCIHFLYVSARRPLLISPKVS